jgi:hypothetical protein
MADVDADSAAALDLLIDPQWVSVNHPGLLEGLAGRYSVPLEQQQKAQTAIVGSLIVGH